MRAPGDVSLDRLRRGGPTVLRWSTGAVTVAMWGPFSSSRAAGAGRARPGRRRSAPRDEGVDLRGGRVQCGLRVLPLEQRGLDVRTDDVDDLPGLGVHDAGADVVEVVDALGHLRVVREQALDVLAGRQVARLRDELLDEVRLGEEVDPR